MSHDPDSDHEQVERFEYFMLRLTRSVLEPDRVTGLIEQLGSGEKRSFETGEQLVQMVGGRFMPTRNRQLADDGPDLGEQAGGEQRR